MNSNATELEIAAKELNEAIRRLTMGLSLGTSDSLTPYLDRYVDAKIALALHRYHQPKA